MVTPSPPVGPLFMMKEQGYSMPIEYLMWLPLIAVSVVLYATLAAAALFSVRNSLWVSVAGRRAWAAVIVLIPVAGAVLWLFTSHRRILAFPDEAEDPSVGAGDDSVGNNSGSSEGRVESRTNPPTKSLT